MTGSDMGKQNTGDMNLDSQPEEGDNMLTQLQNAQVPNVEDVQEWLVVQIAGQLEVDPNEIDIQTPFSRYGLTSLQAASITALGKQMFGLPLSPLVLWNFPNIELLAQFLVEELAKSESEHFEI